MNYLLIGLGFMVAGFAISAYAKVVNLEKKLKEKNIIEENWDKSE